jgi:hypothetical protein
MNILISGARSFASLELVRLLSKKHTVFAADSKTHAIAFSSRFTKGRCVFPSLREDYENAEKAIVDFIRRESIDVFIPTCEEIFYISRMKPGIETQTKCQVFCADHSKLLQLHSKWEYRSSMPESSHVALPESQVFENRAGLEIYLSGNPDYAYVSKMEFSRFASNIASNRLEGRELEKFETRTG